MTLDRDACYRALRARDARFDGRLFAAVRTTGIYCRPICPAPGARRENLVYFPSAAAAQEAGFRPCLRCRPECSPDVPAWRGTSSTVRRALALIAEGALDGGSSGVEDLAARLGIGERQLRRLFREHLGATPVAVAQTRRVLFAKQLLHETDMRMVDVALAAGFSSRRRFNGTFRELFGRSPSLIRRDAHAGRGGSGITLTLSHAGPYDWKAMAAFFAARAIPGVECVDAERYRRTVELGGCQGTIEVAPVRGRRALAATIRLADVKVLPQAVARVRRMFDLGSDIRAITAHLAEDRRLAPLVAARPGLRVPGAWDGFELAVRAVLGQQVTVSAARQLAGRLAAAYGTPLAAPEPGLTTVFPRPERLAGIDAGRLGMPRARAAALRGLAAAAAADPTLFEPVDGLDARLDRLRALPGIGEWTAQYIALRALREPDAFPAADIGLLRAMTEADGTRPRPAELLARAEAWRPWRGYAAQHLWTADAASAARRKEDVA